MGTTDFAVRPSSFYPLTRSNDFFPKAAESIWTKFYKKHSGERKLKIAKMVMIRNSRWSHAPNLTVSCLLSHLLQTFMV